MMSILRKQIKNTNSISKIILNNTTSNVINKNRLYTSIINNNNNNNSNNNNSSKDYEFKFDNNRNEKNNSNNNNNRGRTVMYGLSIGGIFNLFGIKQQEEEENPYSKLSNRVKGTPIESFEDALDWYTRYYTHPEPEQFITAMKLLLGKQSKFFVRQLLNNAREESDMKSIARISTIQSFYYLPLVGFMIEMFKQNPTQLEKWYKELTSDSEISTPWKSALGDLDAVMLINLSVLLTGSPQSKLLEEKILSNYYTPQDDEKSKKEKAEKFKSWALAQKKSIQSLPLILIGEYFASGKEDLVKQVSSIWRSSLDNLEVMGIQNTDQANTTNNVAKKLEFQNRELIIDQLNQAIRLLAKDPRACVVLKNEVEHQIKLKEERVKQYK